MNLNKAVNSVPPHFPRFCEPYCLLKTSSNKNNYLCITTQPIWMWKCFYTCVKEKSKSRNHTVWLMSQKKEAWRWKDRFWVRVTRWDCVFIALIVVVETWSITVKSAKNRAGLSRSKSTKTPNLMASWCGRCNLLQKHETILWVSEKLSCLFYKHLLLICSPPILPPPPSILMLQTLYKSNFLGLPQVKFMELGLIKLE